MKLNYPSFWQTINLKSLMLLPLSFLFILGALIRKVITRKIYFPYKVICVGNATVGGAGKTQIVIWLVKLFNKMQIKCCIVSKGYLGKFTEPVIVDPSKHSSYLVGDEALLLHKHANVIVTSNVHNISHLLDQLNPKIVIFDDGMQNPGFHKDFTILAIDGSRGFGNQLILPAGPMRELLCFAKRRAHCAFILAGEKEQKIQKSLSPLPYFTAATKILNNLDYTKKYRAFAGIGNPEKFFHILRNHNISLTETHSFPDHHNFTYDELDKLLNISRAEGSILLTTKKDFVRIPVSYHDVVIPLDVELEFENSGDVISFIKEQVCA